MDDTPPFFRGYKGFEEVRGDNKLSQPGRLIRVYNYGTTAPNEGYYIIGIGGRLFDVRTDKEVDPKEVLSEERAPDGWSVEGIELTLLPDEEIVKVLKS